MLKFIICLSSIFFIHFTSFTQAPQGFNYQGVARDNNGIELINQEISLRFSLVNAENNPSEIYYTELHSPTTNEFGLFDVVIGEGSSLNDF